MRYCMVFSSMIGNICIIEEDGFIVEINVIEHNQKIIYPICETKVLLKAKKQLEEYFALKRTNFDLPIKMNGTRFQMKVWQELLKISYGETKSYSEIASLIDNPKASRAVGRACFNNHIIIVIPCHRVIGKNKKLVGFNCGLDIKEKLLALEGVYND